MAWLSRNNFTPSDYIHADDLNNLANDLRTWGGDVNGGGYVLANVRLQGAGGFQYYISPLEITGPTAGAAAVTQYDHTSGSVPNQTYTIRWTAGQDGSAETGSNAGSNYAITRFDDSGALLGTPLTINRASGLITTGPGGMQWGGPVNAAYQGLSNVGHLTVVADSGAGIPAQLLVVGVSNVNQQLLIGYNTTSDYGSIQAVKQGSANEPLILNAAGGHVGIGKSAPAYALDVVGDCNITGAFRVNGTAIGGGGSQTPWTSNIDGGGFTLTDVAKIAVGKTSASYAVDVVGDCNITGAFRVNGAAIGTGGGAQTPWTQNIDGGGYTLTDVAKIGVGKTSASYAVDVVGDCNITGTFRVNGTAIGTGSGLPQTPWASNIDAAGYSLSGVANIGIGTSSPLTSFHVHTGTNQNILAGSLSWILTGAVGLSAVNDANSSSIPMAFNANSFVFNGGNVGIGTASPAVALHVIGGVYGSVFQINMASKTASGNQSYGFTSTGDGASSLQAFMAMYTDPTATNRRLSFTCIEQGIAWRNITFNENGAGNVGIGLSGPTSQLHIQGPTGTAAPLPGPGTVFIQDSGGGVNNGGAIVFGSSTGMSTGIKALLQNGSGPIGDLAFYTRNLTTDTTLTERLRITGAGNIGIGTGAPATQLSVIPPTNPTSVATATQISIGESSNNPSFHLTLGYYLNGTLGQWQGVVQNLAGGSGATLLLNPSGGAVAIGNTNPGALLSLGTGTGDKLAVYDGGAGNLFGFGIQTSLFQMYAPSGANISLGVGSSASFTAYLTINGPTGRVGIGKTAPAYALDVAGDCNITGTFRVNGTAISTGGGGVTSIAGTANQIAVSASTGAVTVSVPANPSFSGNLNITGQYQINGVALATGITGVQVGSNEGPIQSTHPWLNFDNGASTSVSVTDHPSYATIQFNYASDAVLKTNVRDLEGGLPIVRKLRPVSFEWNGLAGFKAGQRNVAVLAQELREVLPDCVFPFRKELRPTEEPTEILGYEPLHILFHTVLALQQLDQRMHDLEGIIKRKEIL
jgi:Chaperone of endosialidase